MFLQYREPLIWVWWGSDHDAGTYVPCSDQVNPHVSQESKRRPVTHCQQFQKLLGLMSAASNVIPFGLLYMRPSGGSKPRDSPRGKPTSYDQGHTAIDMWRKPLVFVSRPGAGSSCCRVTLATDASLTGWGAVMSDHPACGLPDLRDRHLWCDT